MAALVPLLTCWLCAALFIAALLCVVKGFKRSALNLPPGPFPLPIIGNLHLLDIRRQDRSLMKISEKYGPVFTVHLGMQQAVVLSGYEAVKDALLNTADVFADRPAIPIFHHIQHGNGVFFSSQELWKTTRRFTLAAMRELGMGKRLAEERMLEELQFLTELIKSFQGGPFRLRLLNAAPTNITFAILFGRRFDYADPTFVTLLRLIDEVMLLLGSPFLHLFNFYPFLGFLLKPHKMILKKVEEVCVILKKHIQESKANINGNSLMSYIDALVFKQEEDNKSNTIFHDANVLASALDLLMAGTETTSTTLQWAVLLMMKYPEIQKKVRAEIERVLGPGCLPTFEDRKSMPFTNAVIHEVQRFVTLLPHVPRCTSADTHFKGYFIPKGTTVIPLLSSVLLDKTQWETPDEFNPNHFLDADGNFVKKKAFLPFSTGRRNCIGESLATVELFIFFTGLMQKFTFKPPPGVKESELNMAAEAGFTMRPSPQCACAVLRREPQPQSAQHPM
ncbi:cytochrome P450 2W1 isoform X1 [Tympanuchus pallidicinctus]|uniref:cytochrome P450 2W1 isoform X1 n=1 Tax=Tympanuchus pallidicinctus TaxID=109042 RepID=UPI002287673D|nr:cytochrome P450 2W1 isoform X1 [Tympanuchus pallidicinctus]